MSMDYPDYLKIREKSRLGGWLWMIGDRGYYIGLLGASFAFITATMQLLFMAMGLATPEAGVFNKDTFPLVPMFLSVPVFIAIFFVSVYLKQTAHRLGGTDRRAEEQQK